MWFDAVAALVLLAFVVLGALRGTLSTLLRIVALGLAYLAAVVAAPRLGPELSERFTLPGPLGLIAAGGLGFLGAFVLCTVAVKLIQVFERSRREGSPRSSLDRLGGALLGGTQGAFVVLLLGLLGGFLEAGRATGSLTALPEIAPSKVSQVSQQLVERGAKWIVPADEPGTRIAVRMVTRPADSVQRVQTLLSNPRILALQSDEAFWAYVGAGALDQALNQASFLGLAHDETTRKSLAELGLIDELDASDPRIFRAAVREVLAEAAPKVRALRSDPEIRRLLQDPELLAAYESGNTFALLTHPTMREVIDRVMAAGSAPAAPALDQSDF
jgi:uncharacterized membrane protein required for colicin V production